MTLPNLPPENRELFLISELHKIKNPFSLFRQQAANFQISTIWANALHWHIQNKFCLSKNGIARQYCISLEKENYNDIGTPLDFRQENTSESRRCCNVNTRSENRRGKHKVATTLSDVATKIQLKPNVVTTSCASWVKDTSADTEWIK